MPLIRLTHLDGDAILPLAAAKLHLRLDEGDDSEDAVVKAYRDAAIAQVERAAGVILAPAEFRWTLVSLNGPIAPPIGPITEVLGLVYWNSDGAEELYDDAQLIDNTIWPAPRASWPTAHGYAAVDFVAGHVTPGHSPELMMAVQLLLAHFYTNREASADRALHELPFGVQALIAPHQPLVA